MSVTDTQSPASSRSFSVENLVEDLLETGGDDGSVSSYNSQQDESPLPQPANGYEAAAAAAAAVAAAATAAVGAAASASGESSSWPDLAVGQSLTPELESVARRVSREAIHEASAVNQQHHQQQQPHQQQQQQQRQETAGDWSIDSPRLNELPPEATAAAAAASAGKVQDWGISSLPRQLSRRSIRRGYDFRLLLVGESGVGKTTLIDSLFNVESTRNLGSAVVPLQTESTTRLCERYFELEEGGITVRLTVIDTPGFAAEIDASGCAQPVVDYIDKQLDDYYRQEQGLQRSRLHDSRVHAALYLLNPSSRGLRQLDVMCMRQLHKRVNLIPVIGKADSLTSSERQRLKARIVEDLERYHISAYSLPEFEEASSSEDVYLRDQFESLRSAMPLAVVGASTLVRVESGHWLRAREYPWGIVDIDNPLYSDFLKLRELLIMYMEDLKDRTHEVIYEELRLSRIRQSDRNIAHLSQTLQNREQLLQQKEAELQRLQAEVASLMQPRSRTLPAQQQRQHHQVVHRSLGNSASLAARQHVYNDNRSSNWG